jgi:hypothetical protein
MVRGKEKREVDSAYHHPKSGRGTHFPHSCAHQPNFTKGRKTTVRPAILNKFCCVNGNSQEKPYFPVSLAATYGHVKNFSPT